MGVYNGTAGSDILAGTASDDTFNDSSTGSDILSGLGGYDKAYIDYSSITGSAGVGQSIGYDDVGLYCRFMAQDGLSSIETHGIEEIHFTSGAQNDSFYVDLTSVPAGWNISLNAGAGIDSVQLHMPFDSPGLVGSVISGTLTSGGLTLSSFEQFYLVLGRGNDQLTLGAGNDTVQASEGNDVIDGAAGDDTIEGELGGDTINGGDGNDQLYADNAYVMLDNGSEHDVVNGGAGDDIISIGYGDDADGGTGTDRLLLSLRGGPAGAYLDLSSMFAGGTITIGGGTIKGFETYGAIYGTDFADTIITGNAPNQGDLLSSGIFGFGGDDTITTGIDQELDQWRHRQRRDPCRRRR